MKIRNTIPNGIIRLGNSGISSGLGEVEEVDESELDVSESEKIDIGSGVVRKSRDVFI